MTFERTSPLTALLITRHVLTPRVVIVPILGAGLRNDRASSLQSGNILTVELLSGHRIPSECVGHLTQIECGPRPKQQPGHPSIMALISPPRTQALQSADKLI